MQYLSLCFLSCTCALFAGSRLVKDPGLRSGGYLPPTLAAPQVPVHLGRHHQLVQLTQRPEQHRHTAALEAAELRDDLSDPDRAVLISNAGDQPCTSPTFGDVDLLCAKKSANELRVREPGAPTFRAGGVLLTMLRGAVGQESCRRTCKLTRTPCTEPLTLNPKP